MFGFGLESWLSSCEHLLLQRTWILFLTPMWWLTAIYNLSSSESYAFFWPLWAPGTHVVLRHTCRWNQINKSKKIVWLQRNIYKLFYLFAYVCVCVYACTYTHVCECSSKVAMAHLKVWGQPWVLVIIFHLVSIWISVILLLHTPG